MILKDYSYKDLLDTTIIIGEADDDLWGYPICFYRIDKGHLVLQTYGVLHLEDLPQNDEPKRLFILNWRHVSQVKNHEHELRKVIITNFINYNTAIKQVDKEIHHMYQQILIEDSKLLNL